ncbi:MAG: IreB family regulatory phosphoprotein [Bacilli bacterium]|nr:IreB family regulatory phosphoprotein [Bacilli bacterium]
MDKTKVYDSSDFQEALIAETIKDVANILEERGYNAINQIVGYLMSGDPGYISSHKEARNKITKFERTEILEVLVKRYLDK